MSHSDATARILIFLLIQILEKIPEKPIVTKKYTSIPSACLHQGLQFQLLTHIFLF